MGKPTGFLDYSRKTAPYRPVRERIKDYKEVSGILPDDEIKIQGARCMDCGIPYCHACGCPVFNLIPEWNDFAYRSMWKEAYERLEITNTLPEITGRICPAPCESACTLSINTAPVSIKQIELSLVEKAFAEGWAVPRPPKFESEKKIAIIGSGPAGLAACQILRRMGHSVTVFEKFEKPGGILRYGIPDFKLDKKIIDRRIKLLEAEGVRFETGVVIGEDLSARYLKNNYDIILLTIGAGQPRDLRVPGREQKGIHFAMEYLTGSNKSISREIKNLPISAAGKNVLVIGGGDTGSDCVGTAVRQGASSVTQIEILPKPPEQKEPWNPSWPDWPNVLRTSSSHEEGCSRDWNVNTLSFNGQSGSVREAVCAKVEWKKNEKGINVPEIIKGSEFSIKAELVLLSMGFVHVEHGRLIEELGVEYDEKGNIKTKPGTYQTNIKSVFAAGDADIGASLVVRAIFHGQEAAKSINEALKPVL